MKPEKNKPASITQAPVAIITVTYNAGEFIGEYLNAVGNFIAQNDHSIAIIVDNQSQDDTLSIIQQHIADTDTDRIIVHASSSNLGFGKGCNQGAEIAKSYNPKYLWFLNPDTIIEESTGPALIDLLDKNSHIDFTGSTLLNEHQQPRPGAFRFPTIANVALSNLRIGVLDKLLSKHTTAEPISEKPQKVDWLTGASFMVRADCFYQLEGFDRQYFLYFEEVDLFNRARKLGYEAWSCPASRVYHMSGASTGINKREVQLKRQPSYWFESRRHYYISNYNYLYFLLIDMTFIICHSLWLIRAKIQKKPSATPPSFGFDTLYHGHIKPIVKRK